jgi:hypothetical protein
VVNLDNDERSLFVVTASRTVEYYISCEGLPQATYAIGESVTMKKTFITLEYSTVIVPALAVTTAAVITVVVAIKRRNYRRATPAVK